MKMGASDKTKIPAQLDREIEELLRANRERAAKEREERRRNRYGGIRPGSRLDV